MIFDDTKLTEISEPTSPYDPLARKLAKFMLIEREVTRDLVQKYDAVLLQNQVMTNLLERLYRDCDKFSARWLREQLRPVLFADKQKSDTSPTERPCCVEAYARGHAVGLAHRETEKPKCEVSLPLLDGKTTLCGNVIPCHMHTPQKRKYVPDEKCECGHVRGDHGEGRAPCLAGIPAPRSNVCPCEQFQLHG
jgi:hypothetical protein